ncbi:armadillo-type protein [Dichotomocladium elegans]|nr:armadillo-type protein [Dichotomocladium elegans]
MATASVTQVLEALSTLYSSPDPQAKKRANRWLDAFQKQPEAWTTADYLLKSSDTNTETRLFAAQTFRQKITYDLRDLDEAARLTLRDTLVERLTASSSGPKVVTLQLCLALADLAIQLVSWNTAVQDMVNKFGGSTDTAICLLEFLRVLPEEMAENHRIPLSDTVFKEQNINLVQKNASEVMGLLVMYFQSSGGNTEIQELVFTCLSSWLRTGDVDIRFLAESPLLALTFDALSDPSLFDPAIDLACEIIYETRDVNESRDIIHNIYGRIVPLLPKLKEAKEEEDSDAVRGFCRLLVAAGEIYVPLIAQHPASLSSLLDGIIECTAYNDLEIVPITFKFWYELKNTVKIPRFQSSIPALSPYYDTLVDLIIGHLHYPEESHEWTAEERDDFRDFRHEMGDTLKDCCNILGAERCLQKPLAKIQGLLSQPHPAKWQQLEAPIFSLRSMGSEVPDNEDKVMPQILELLSKLPDHPKIRYAATLVISRYSFWTRLHPQYITYQLNFISAGFQNDEVAAASALALKHLCKDCSGLLVDYISELHPFYTSVIRTLPFSDALEVTEAVAHVLAEVPVANLQNALQQFCLPLAQDLHAIVMKDETSITREDCVRVGDLLEEIAAFIEVIHPDIPLGQPHPCVNFVNDLWPIFDLCLKKFGTEGPVCEQLGKCFKNCVQSYKLHFVPLLPQLMERIVSGFDYSGLSVYLYVALKIIKVYGAGGPENAAVCLNLVERMSATMFTRLTEKKFQDMPDVVNEYFRMVTELLQVAPTHLVQSPLLPSIFQAALAGLSMEEFNALNAILGFYRSLLDIAISVDELVPGDVPATSATIGQNSARVASIFMEMGNSFMTVLFNGLISHYNWEIIPDVASILKCLAQILPTETSEWIVVLVNNIPDLSMPAAEKSEFLQSYMSAIHEKHWAKARRVLSDFIISYRRKNSGRERKE